MTELSGPGWPGGPPPRGALRLLGDRSFGAIFWAKMLTAIGVWMHVVISAVIVYEQTGSALVVGLVNVAQFLPQLFLAPLAGAWADRGHTVRLVVNGRWAALSGSLLLTLWFVIVGVGGPSVVPILVGTAIVGIGFAISGPALQSIVPSLVTRAELPVAMGLNTAPMTLGVVIGPPLGSLVASFLGPVPAFGIETVLCLGSVLILMWARLPRLASPDAGSGRRTVLAAVSYTRVDPVLLVLLAGVAVIGVGAETSVTLAPPLVDSLGGRHALVGVVSGSFGVGSALSFFLYAAFSRLASPERLVQIGTAAMAAGLALVATVPALVPVLAGFAICGFTIALSAFSALVQGRIPDALRGRIMALWMVSQLVSRPLGSAFEGLISDLTTPRVAVGATAVLLAGMLALARPSVLRRLPPLT